LLFDFEFFKLTIIVPKSSTQKNGFLTPVFQSRPPLHKVNDVLAVLFYSIWILIGVFFLLVIVGQIRQGALSSIVGSPAQSQVPQVEVPTETNLPGIGKVNIECVQNNLDQTVIQKLVQEGVSALTEEEKEKLTPCIVEAESPQPSAPTTQ
jgi:hypothetical protein